MKIAQDIDVDNVTVKIIDKKITAVMPENSELEIEEIINENDISYFNIRQTNFDNELVPSALGRIKGTDWYVLKFKEESVNTFIEIAKENRKKIPFSLEHIFYGYKPYMAINGSNNKYGVIALKNSISNEQILRHQPETIPKRLELVLQDANNKEQIIAEYALQDDGYTYSTEQSIVYDLNTTNYKLFFRNTLNTLEIKEVSQVTNKFDYEALGNTIINVNNIGNYSNSSIKFNINITFDDSINNIALAIYRMKEYDVPIKSVQVDVEKKGLFKTVPDNYLLDNLFIKVHNLDSSYTNYNVNELVNNSSTIKLNFIDGEWTVNENIFTRYDTNLFVEFRPANSNTSAFGILYPSYSSIEHVKFTLNYSNKPDIIDLDEIIDKFPLETIKYDVALKSVIDQVGIEPTLYNENGSIKVTQFGEKDKKSYLRLPNSNDKYAYSFDYTDGQVNNKLKGINLPSYISSSDNVMYYLNSDKAKRYTVYKKINKFRNDLLEKDNYYFTLNSKILKENQELGTLASIGITEEGHLSIPVNFQVFVDRQLIFDNYDLRWN